jgi:uncharacterized membrane protein YfcA
MSPKNILLGALLVVAVAYVVFWIRLAGGQRHQSTGSSALHGAIGFGTNFFDTLGISSFATTTTMYRLLKLVPDQKIPGTLNVGHAVPTFVQAFIFITIVQVDFQTLVLLIVASVVGAWLGAGVVSRLPRQQIQRGMGIALLAAAALMVMTALDLFPGGGEALALTDGKLILAIGITLVLGALMTLGIGAYAPIMIMVSLLGMNPTAAFPIMMGACAFLMPAASIQFIRTEKYDLRAAAGLAIGGAPAVIIAALIVRSLPLAYVRWLVVVVVLYAAVTLLHASLTSPASQKSAAAS